jgi:hypothetical protein
MELELELISCAVLNEPIGDLDDMAYSPGSKDLAEDEPTPSKIGHPFSMG